MVGTAEENSTVAKVVEYMRAGDDDPDIRVIVLTGVGRAFCAGANLASRATQDVTGENFVGNRAPHEGADGARQHFYHGFTALHRDISLIRKPTIAMINGPAVGSGMDMALHCDIRVGCEKTRFIAYHNAGQIIENGGSYYLPKMVGLGRALEFVYTGELNAERAYEWGMLNHLVPAEELEAATRELCDRIIARPPLVQWVKEVVRPAEDRRGLILLSHHQDYSGFQDHYAKPAQQLWDAGVQKRVLWFWGHEHRLAGYDVHGTGLLKSYGRCVGHGGMPVELGMPIREPRPLFYPGGNFRDATNQSR